jgi:hypothetical protein
MALNLPFMKKKEKKEKTIEELRTEFESAKFQFQSKITKEVKDPISARLAEFGFSQETFEKFQHRHVPTEFPNPLRRFRLVLEYPNFNIEQTYYWFLRYLTETWGFERAEKVIDTMAQSVSSSMFGNMQTRIGAQQAQASQYLKGVSDMVKGLFQIVREIRILDERLQYYYDSDGSIKGSPSNALSSEIVLKGLWIDQVEGGAKNPASVYGLSSTVGFTVLPDLFFRMHIKEKSKLEIEVDKLKFNAKVREVLKRKLRQYYEWKERTKRELEVRRTFEIKYLRQHYDTIKMYMAWIKPYLRNIKRMQLYERNMENPNIINAFETQIIELETLFVRNDFGPQGKAGHESAVVSMHIFFRVKPELAFHSYEYQHKGPIYSGMADITLRAYTWDSEKIKKYKEYRTNDDLELMGTINESVQQAMDALGSDLKKYLKEAGEDLPFVDDPKKKEPYKQTINLPAIFEPFAAIFEGFAELAKGFMGDKNAAPKEKGGGEQKKPYVKSRKDEIWESRAHHFATEAIWEAYYRYKMGPGGNIYWVE